MRIVGIIIALIFAGATFYFALELLGKDDGEQPILVQTSQADVQESSIQVASRDISIGERVTTETIEGAQWPTHLMVDGFVASGEQSKAIMGFVARTPFVKGEPINTSRLSNPSDPSFIAANLPAGMRMATISSDNIAGLAGFVYPGDRVDVIITREMEFSADIEEKTGLGKTEVTETLLSNIKVLAVNQRATAVPVDTEDKSNRRDAIPSSISLEVTPSQAQQLRLGQEAGYLSLALRSLDDANTINDPIVTTLPDITFVDDMDVFTSLVKETATVSMVRGTQKVDMEVPVIREDTPEDEKY